MKTFLVTRKRVTTSEPYTELPPERIEVRYGENSGLLFLPNHEVIQEKHPRFSEILHNSGIPLGRNPALLDRPSFEKMREQIGINVETDNPELFAALMELD